MLTNWVVAFTYFAPLALRGRAWLYKRPRLGLALWLSLFSGSVLAAVAAIGLAVFSAFENWMTMHRDGFNGGWLPALIAGFAPWAILAAGGILMAIASTKFEQLYSKAAELDPDLLGGRQVGERSGFKLFEIPLDIAYIGCSGATRSVVYASGIFSVLNADEFEAALAHEVAHLRARHPQMLSFVRWVGRLFSAFKASAILESEVYLLCELAADRGVGDQGSLRSGLEKIVGHEDLEVRIRLSFAK